MKKKIKIFCVLEKFLNTRQRKLKKSCIWENFKYKHRKKYVY